MRTPAQQRGDAAEAEVERRLTAAGWAILARKLRVGRAEIDLLAVDPGPPRQLVIVEVRWRSGRNFGLPEETVGHAKWSGLRVAAYRLFDGGSLPDGREVPRLPVRIDLVVLEPGALRHHRHVA